MGTIMKDTAKAIVEAVVGGADAADVAALLTELERDSSDTQLLLATVEHWAQQRMVKRGRARQAGEVSSGAVPKLRLVRRAALTVEEPDKAATIHDLVDVLSGRASELARKRVAASLEDPSSLVSQAVNRLNTR